MTITAASADWLADFTRQLVADRLAAGGNITPSLRSIYWWQGKIEDQPETSVTLHTRRALVTQIIDRTNQEHPYDTPLILAVPVVEVDPRFHQWVLDETRKPSA